MPDSIEEHSRNFPFVITNAEEIIWLLAERYIAIWTPDGNAIIQVNGLCRPRCMDLGVNEDHLKIVVPDLKGHIVFLPPSSKRIRMSLASYPSPPEKYNGLWVYPYLWKREDVFQC